MAIYPYKETEQASMVSALAYELASVRETIFGLSDEQIRMTPCESTFNLGGLIKHLSQVLPLWMAALAVAPQAMEIEHIPAEDFPTLVQKHQDSCRILPQEAVVDILAGFDAAVTESLVLVATLDPDTLVPVPDLPWTPKDEPNWSVRWIMTHLLQETARHAGHADIIRETLDGARADELHAAVHKLPPNPFTRPWRPEEN